MKITLKHGIQYIEIVKISFTGIRAHILDKGGNNYICDIANIEKIEIIEENNI